MKKAINILTACIVAAFLSTSCNTNSTKQNQQPQADTLKAVTDSSITITAKYIDGASFEGDEELTFEKEDGSQIVFYINQFDKNEPKLDYNFLGQDNLSPNKELIGSQFIIKYKPIAKGKISAETGEAEPGNHIIKIEKK